MFLQRRCERRGRRDFLTRSCGFVVALSWAKAGWFGRWELWRESRRKSGIKDKIISGQILFGFEVRGIMHLGFSKRRCLFKERCFDHTVES